MFRLKLRPSFFFYLNFTQNHKNNKAKEKNSNSEINGNKLIISISVILTELIILILCIFFILHSNRFRFVEEKKKLFMKMDDKVMIDLAEGIFPTLA